MTGKKKILLFSTLNPFPHWAGSENLWFDLVSDREKSKNLDFHIRLAESPVTRQKAENLRGPGISTSFYVHHNDSFIRRNFSRLKDKLTKSTDRTWPWYNEIEKGKYDLVFFNVAALADLADLSYAVNLCISKKIPYWLLLQHGYEDFFLNSLAEIEKVKKVVHGARRFVFISRRNRAALERAIGENLSNAFHSFNAIPASKLEEARALSEAYPVSVKSKARFFNLGRFSPKDKAQHLLLEVLSGSGWKERDWQLSFIGVSGFGKDSLETLIKYYKLDPQKIKILPHTEKVMEAIVQHDLLLMPSLSEGTPFAMVESMACGRPALGTPVGGIPELILEGSTGWLCSSVDVNALAQKMEQCWMERDKWQEYGKAAQELVNRDYNQDRTFGTLVRLLEEDAK